MKIVVRTFDWSGDEFLRVLWRGIGRYVFRTGRLLQRWLTVDESSRFTGEPRDSSHGLASRPTRALHLARRFYQTMDNRGYTEPFANPCSPRTFIATPSDRPPMPIAGFDHAPGAHCGSTSLRNLADYHGWGFDEPTCFGLASGLGLRDRELDESPHRMFVGRPLWLERASFGTLASVGSLPPATVLSGTPSVRLSCHGVQHTY
jgi:hypothetical protein